MCGEGAIGRNEGRAARSELRMDDGSRICGSEGNEGVEGNAVDLAE